MLSPSTRRIVFGRKGSNSPLSASTTALPRPCVLLRISRRSRRPIRLLRSMTIVPMHGCRNNNTKDRDGFQTGDVGNGLVLGDRSETMSAMGHKRTFSPRKDIAKHGGNVCFVPKADIHRLLDHLVGAQTDG